MDKQRKKAILHVKYTLKYNHNNWDLAYSHTLISWHVSFLKKTVLLTVLIGCDSVANIQMVNSKHL